MIPLEAGIPAAGWNCFLPGRGVRRVKHNLIVLPELLKETQAAIGLFSIIVNNLIQRTAAIHLIEEIVLRCVYGQNKIGLLVCAIPQDCHAAGSSLAARTFRPRDSDGNIVAPLFALEIYGLIPGSTIAPVGDEVVPRNAAPE